ncbi:MAG: hypothetical protein AAFQ07_05795 [Chloroflexota bacterium]
MTLATPLFKAGLLQFGRFIAEDGTPSPYRIRLEMLAAYPALLQQITYRGVQSLATATPFDRLVALSDSIPIATSLALNTGISLVYSRGTNEPLVHDLVGAYDVGHPACLIVNSANEHTSEFIQKSRKVGLEIHTVLEVIAQGYTLPNVTQLSILTIPAVIHELRQNNTITQHMADAVLKHA